MRPVTGGGGNEDEKTGRIHWAACIMIAPAIDTHLLSSFLGEFCAAKISSDERNRRRAGGFTFVELIIVITLLGIIAAIGGPMLFSSVETTRMTSVTSEVATAFRFARSSAMGSARPCRVTVNPAAETILVEQLVYFDVEDLTDLSKPEVHEDVVERPDKVGYVPMAHPVNKGTDYRIDFVSGSDFGGVDITTAAFGAGLQVTFDKRGVPSDGGYVNLIFGNHQGKVTVDAATGKVAIL